MLKASLKEKIKNSSFPSWLDRLDRMDRCLLERGAILVATSERLILRISCSNKVWSKWSIWSSLGFFLGLTILCEELEKLRMMPFRLKEHHFRLILKLASWQFL